MTTREFIAKEEGYSEVPYRDSAGFWTIGWGRLLSTDKDADPSQWSPVTKEEEMRVHFGPDVERRKRLVIAMFVRKMHDYQITALTSFAYNLGMRSLETSVLRIIINNGANGDSLWPLRVGLEWV